MPVYLVPVAFTHYASRSDLEREFGTENIRTWADKDNDNDSTKIAANIDYSLTLAERFINVRASQIGAPVPDTSSGLYYGLADFQITYAGVQLYKSRGQITAGTMGSEGAGVYDDMLIAAEKTLDGLLFASLIQTTAEVTAPGIDKTTLYPTWPTNVTWSYPRLPYPAYGW